MTVIPEISVVMGVYNGASELRETMTSVLIQRDVSFEFIVVDDGSTDETASVLADMATTDPRIRVLRQDNQGLTRALMSGCAAAAGQFIARQDCGDISLPDRLARQLRLLKTHPDAVLASCGARFLGPGGEALYDIVPEREDATEGLLALDLASVRGPAHHGSTMFRRDAYTRAGGYRHPFYFAQDLDLWTRLADHGRHLVIQEILYEARFAFSSITSRQRGLQVACAKLILESAQLRRQGLSDVDTLARASTIRPRRAKSQPWTRAAALYFVGNCLRDRADPAARRYFLQALRAWPLHYKSAARLLMG